MKFFADLGDQWKAHRDAFGKYLREHKIRKLHISPSDAPYLDNFLAGANAIQDFILEGKLSIPMDIPAYDQMAAIPLENLGDSPETEFWAMNALRFAVGALKKQDYRPNAADWEALDRLRKRGSCWTV